MALAGTPEARNSECSQFLRRVSAAMIAQGNSESPAGCSPRGRPDTPRRETFKTAPGLIASAAHHPQSVHLTHPTQGAAPAGPVRQLGLSGSRGVWVKGVSTLEPHTAIVR